MEDDKEHRKTKGLVEDIRGRAKYTLELLHDKEKMLKEKQLSMLVKQKMQIHREESVPATGKRNSMEEQLDSSGKEMESVSYQMPEG